MKFKSIIFLAILALLPSLAPKAQAQEATNESQADTTTVQLRGRVTDQQGDPVPMCAVRVEGQVVTALANADGQYSITFQSADSVVVLYSMIGFDTRRKVLRKPQGKMVMHIVLSEKSSELGQVVVAETRRQMGSTQELNTKELKRLPSTTGNAVEELVATQAGVSSHNELSSQYNVRGGSFDENCVYINGVEVYRPLLVSSGQQEGLSVINSDMVKKVEFSAGGFEARYGDRMSSVLDITYARPEHTEATIQASLLGASLYLGLGNKHVSLAQGLRYKTNQYMLGSLETKGEYKPTFLDYQAYFSWNPSKAWTFDLIGYISQNNYQFAPADRETHFGTMEDVKSFKVYFDGQEQDLFRTLFATFRATHRWGSQNELSLAFSTFGTKERETYDIQGQYWLNEAGGDSQLGVGTYMEHARNTLNSHTQDIRLNYTRRLHTHHIQAGLGWRHEAIHENSREWEHRDSSGYNIPHTGNDLRLIYNLKSQNTVNGHRIELFAQDTWRTEGRLGILSFNYGARLSYWNWNNEWLLSPRASIGYVPKKNDAFTFRLATGLYYQSPFYKELRDTTSIHGNTTVRLNQKIRAQQSFQTVLGMEYKFKLDKRPMKLTTEVYYKAQNHMNPYNVDNVKIVYYGNNAATGYVVGADVKLYGEFVPGTDSWISFGVMKASMKLNGKTIPQPTDQRYNLNLFFSDYFPGTTRWKMNLKATFADGLPFGPPHTGLERNVFRAPAYRRVDVGMNYRLVDREDRAARRFALRNIWLGLDCFNIFGLNNVSGYYWVRDIHGQQFAVPNYLTGRMVNARLLIEF